MKLNTIICALMLIFPGVSQAYVWAPEKTISEMREYGNGLAIYGHDLSSTSIPCVNRKAAMPSPTASVDQINRMNSVLLAAYMANKPVILKINTTSCSGDYPFYYSVRIRQ